MQNTDTQLVGWQCTIRLLNCLRLCTECAKTNSYELLICRPSQWIRLHDFSSFQTLRGGVSPPITSYSSLRAQTWIRLLNKLISGLSFAPNVRMLDEGFDGNLVVVNQRSHVCVSLIKRRVWNPKWGAGLWWVQAANLSDQLWRHQHTKPDHRELLSLQSQSETLKRVTIRLKSSHIQRILCQQLVSLTVKPTRLNVNLKKWLESLYLLLQTVMNKMLNYNTILN